MASPSRPPPLIFDFAIDSHWEAAEPFLRRELNSQKALGLILNRRAWWHSWTAAHGTERAQWMLEVDEFLVRMNLVQLSKVWKPFFLDWDDVVADLREATVLPMGSSDRQVALDGLVDELVAKLQSADPYEHYYADGSDNSSEGEWDDSAALTDDDEEMEGEEDSEDEQMLDDDDNVVSFEEACRQRQQLEHSNTEDHHVRSNASETSNDETDPGSKTPFGQVAWVAGLMVLRQRLLTLAPRQATSTAIDHLVHSVPMLENAETMTCAFELIMAGLRAVPPCSIDAVQSLIPVTLEPATLRKLQHHFQLIHARIEEVKQHIAATLDIIIDQLKLVSPDGAVSTTDVCTPGPVLMTWMRDACIAPALKAKLSAELADLRPPPSQQSDTVHNLVDPSLYCSVVGRTKYEDLLPTADGKTTKYATPAMQMRATMDMKPTSGVYTMSRKDTKYGWLPCEVHIADSETVTTAILTYINNLHPETYASLYKSIELLFSQCVPVFENVLSSLDREADKRLLEALYQYGGLSLPSAPRLVPRGLFDVNPPLQSLRGKQCQVVVRIREIQLTPEQPTFGGDDWRDEGTETEQVIATGVVFYRVENLTESRFTCRTFVKCPRDGTRDKFTIGLEYGLYSDELVAQELGQITAVEDRCIVIPNLYQYKLEPFGLKDPMRPGALGMLTFLLVAPPPMARPIISTASVPPQQAHWIEQERTRILTQWGLPECAGMLVAEFARDGMTEVEAQHIRRDVVAKRTLTWESTDYLSFLLSEKGRYFWFKGAIPSREDARAARQWHAMDFRYR